MFFIKDNVKHFVKQMHITNFGIFMLCDKNILGLDKDILFAGIYLPPENSRVYELYNGKDGISLLEDTLSMFMNEYGELSVLLFGDFNSRIGDSLDYIVDDSTDYLLMEDAYEQDTFCLKRETKDDTCNSFGLSLLDLCKLFNVHVLNGRTESDPHGELTFISNIGCSQIDLGIASTELFDNGIDFSVLQHQIEIIDSDHLPIALKVPCQNVIQYQNDNSIVVQESSKVFWKSENKELYLSRLVDERSEQFIMQFCKCIDDDNVNDAVLHIVALLKYAAEPMIQKTYSANPVTKKVVWWDKDLENLKQTRNKLLTKFRRNKNDTLLQKYLQSKKDFRLLVKQKKTDYHEQTYKRLLVAMESNNNKLLWRTLKPMHKNVRMKCQISARQWFDYFSTLLNINVEIDSKHETNVNSTLSEHLFYCELCDNSADDILNSVITLEEIEKCILDMPCGKAPGPDGLCIELFKCNINYFAPLFLELFNKVLKTGIFPDSWCEAIICPLYKGGTKTDQNNYRGISLLNVMGKCFTKICNNRLVQWATINEKYNEAQAGYRKGYSTMDQIFTLQALVQKYLSKKGGRFYIFYVDMSKAFDRISHSCLFYRLITEGIHGRFLYVLMNMYEKLKSSVQVDCGFTSYFDCKTGTRQGCMLSPFIFSLYLNELINSLNKTGIYLSETYPCVNILLYADDIAICANTVGNLQSQINCLDAFCKKWGMKVNLSKSKVMVFRNGGIVRFNEKCFFSRKTNRNSFLL